MVRFYVVRTYAYLFAENSQNFIKRKNASYKTFFSSLEMCASLSPFFSRLFVKCEVSTAAAAAGSSSTLCVQVEGQVDNYYNQLDREWF